jgi:hypothetical protein
VDGHASAAVRGLRDGAAAVNLPIPGTPEFDHLWREAFQRIAPPINPKEMPEPMRGFPVTTDEE